MEPNAYPPRWQAVFGATVDERQTESELAFLLRQLPLPAFERVLDVCCGLGRHARGLAARGYSVVGVERDPGVAAAPRAAGIEVVELDMRSLDRLDGEFDAVLSMWASFGFFDSATNEHVLAQMAARLRPGGRLVVDVMNRAFFRGRDGIRTLERGGRTVVETSELRGRRRLVQLDYGDDHPERYEWELYEPDELASLARAAGLEAVLACARFDERVPPSADEPRLQLVLERVDVDRR